jgi:hypothetical protein
MTDADTGLVERDEQVTIVSINRLRCGNAVERFARSKAWQESLPGLVRSRPGGSTAAPALKKRCPLALQSSTT